MKQQSHMGAILVVDDTSANVALLSRILATEGHTVETAPSGQQALDMIHAAPPDIILLDIRMPEMDGYEICTTLKADAKLQHIPVIFISAVSDSDDIIRALNLGGVDYITKPFQVQEVVARVNSQMMLVEHRREIQRLREQDRERYAAIDDMKNQFIRMATHDLKNPLGIIMGYVHLFEQLQVCDEDSRALLDQGLEGIHYALDKMQNLVMDMLDLAQMGSSAGFELEPTELGPTVAQWINNHKLHAEKKGQTLVFKPAPPDVSIVVGMDPGRFERVVDNLVSNAIKYTPPGGRIDVRIQHDETHACLNVSDTGYGIPPEHVDQIFKAFFRVPDSKYREIEGTGLGLSIVKAIVEQHNGRITVTSNRDQGSTFSVSLPLL